MLRIETAEEYHASEPVSRSTLWTLYNRTPYHAKFNKQAPKAHLDLGDALHKAILEPELFESKVYCGPDDRRGNKWKDAQDMCRASNQLLLTSGDYEKALAMREVAATCEPLQIMLRGTRLTEHSCYRRINDVDVKCRVDLYNADLKTILDIKTCADASPEAFAKAVANYGYHMQEAAYTDIWSKDMDVEAFFFVAIEKPTEENPPVIAVYELDQSAVSEGFAIYQAALARYKECIARNQWPAYSQEVTKISIPRWSFKETQPTGDE